MSLTPGRARAARRGRVLFLYTPAAAGAYIEELLKGLEPADEEERKKLRERFHWEVVWPNPL